jgi:hypothetical protein
MVFNKSTEKLKILYKKLPTLKKMNNIEDELLSSGRKLINNYIYSDSLANKIFQINIPFFTDDFIEQF